MNPPLTPPPPLPLPLPPPPLPPPPPPNQFVNVLSVIWGPKLYVILKMRSY